MICSKPEALLPFIAVVAVRTQGHPASKCIVLIGIKPVCYGLYYVPAYGSDTGIISEGGAVVAARTQVHPALKLTVLIRINPVYHTACITYQPIAILYRYIGWGVVQGGWARLGARFVGLRVSGGGFYVTTTLLTRDTDIYTKAHPNPNTINSITR